MKVWPIIIVIHNQHDQSLIEYKKNSYYIELRSFNALCADIDYNDISVLSSDLVERVFKSEKSVADIFFPSHF